MTWLVPVIHAAPLPANRKRSGGLSTWMAGTSPGTSPVMTVLVLILAYMLSEGAHGHARDAAAIGYAPSAVL